MSLRRLLVLSPAAAAAAAVPGCLRRSLATAAPPPPWAIIARRTPAVEGRGTEPGASSRLDHPPSVSSLCVPKHLVRTSASPDPDSDVIQSISGSICSASSDGLLLLCYIDHRWKAPILARRGAARLRKRTTELDPDHAPDVTHFVCNPVTGELSRLPDPRHPFFHPVGQVMCGVHVGLLTRAESGRDGPPDRFAIAELHGNRMVRFLSETEEWETVAVSPCQFPLARQMVLDDEVVAFDGRLWWLDVNCGAVSADPFSDRPELCFVELPRESLLPAAAQDACDCGEAYGCGKSKHRRLCVSEGRLHYIEVSQEEPFLLSTFVLDDEGTGWTLQHRLDLSRFGLEEWCPHPWLPLKEGNTPQIGFLDPFNHNWVYMSATIATHEDVPQVVFVVDMKDDDVILSYAYKPGVPSFVPCVLSPWLGSSQIPSAGKKDAKKKQCLILVPADRP